jgi:hypothetical protein
MHRSTVLSAPGLAAAVMLVVLLDSSGVGNAGDDPPRRAAVVPPGPACQKTRAAQVSQVQYGSASTGLAYDGGIAPPEAYFYAPPAPPPPRYFPNGALDSSTTARPDWQPWKDVFYDNDFSVLDDPNHDYLVGERLKNMDLRALTIGHMRVPDLECDDPENVEIREFMPLTFLPDPTRISFGGEYRFRQMDEANRLRPPPKPGRADYQLRRWRQYVDIQVDDWFRVYAEMIDASMNNNSLAVTEIDINRWDLQNLFFDVRLWVFDDFDDRPVWFRAGRQELLYGSQRLVSPYDWANIRRNFEGLKLFTRGADWDFDVWLTRPVNTATLGDGPISVFGDQFDSPNMNHTFTGAWFTYKALRNQLFDLYWLWDFNSKLIAPHFAGGDRHTVATRWLGSAPAIFGDSTRTWHGEIEGGYQFGTDFGKNVNAGFFVAGAGHTWNDVPWTPNIWVYYDWASGSNNLNGTTTNTFSQQYGDFHTYLGLIDNIGRQNISDINARATITPLRQMNFQTQYHWFDLENSHDVLYTVNGTPLGKPNTGTHVGEELDLVSNYFFNPNFNVRVGYSWFWYGQFVENNAPRRTAEQLYIQTTLNY